MKKILVIQMMILTPKMMINDKEMISYLKMIKQMRIQTLKEQYLNIIVRDLSAMLRFLLSKVHIKCFKMNLHVNACLILPFHLPLHQLIMIYVLFPRQPKTTECLQATTLITIFHQYLPIEKW